MHPGESNDAIVTWTAPWSGLYTFYIAAILLEANLTCSGCGVLVYYGAPEATKNLTVTGAYPVDFPTYNKALSVRDTFSLRVNRRNRNFCDPTAITLIVTGPSPPAVPLTVSGPIVFDGPWDAPATIVYTPGGYVTVQGPARIAAGSVVELVLSPPTNGSPLRILLLNATEGISGSFADVTVRTSADECATYKVQTQEYDGTGSRVYMCL